MTIFYFLLPDLIGRNEYQVHIDNPANDWLNPDHLPLSWDPAELGGDSVSVDIRLLGYREVGDPGKAEVSFGLYLYIFI